MVDKKGFKYPNRDILSFFLLSFFPSFSVLFYYGCVILVVRDCLSASSVAVPEKSATHRRTHRMRRTDFLWPRGTQWKALH